MKLFTNKEYILLITASLLSALSCMTFSDKGSTSVSMAISAIYITIACFLPLDKQLMFVALGLPNTKALGFEGISCSIIICAIAAIKNFSKARNITPIFLISILFILYCTQFLFRYGDIKLGIIAPVKTGFNLLFFAILANNVKIASNSFEIGLKSTIALLMGIVSAFWVSFNQKAVDTTRVAIEGNDPNMLAVEAAFTASYLCVFYYNNKSFSKWLFLIVLSILAAISLLCGSRMGLILMSLVVFVAILSNTGKFQRSTLLVVVFGGALIAFLFSSTGQAIIEALITRNDNLEAHGNISNDRFELWTMYVAAFNSDFSLWFLGLGSYIEFGIHKQAHNFLIEDIASYGIIGVLILYLTYKNIYSCQYRNSKCFNRVSPQLYTMMPFFVPIIGGLTLHGLTSIINTTMLYLGVLCMTLPKKELER